MSTLEDQARAEARYAEAISRTLVMAAEGLAARGMQPFQAASVVKHAADRALEMFCKRHGVVERKHSDA